MSTRTRTTRYTSTATPNHDTRLPQNRRSGNSVICSHRMQLSLRMSPRFRAISTMRNLGTSRFLPYFDGQSPLKTVGSLPIGLAPIDPTLLRGDCTCALQQLFTDCVTF